MSDERTSRLISLALQFGSFAVVPALAAALIPSAKPTPGPTVAPPPVAAEPDPQKEAFEKFLADAGSLSRE